MSITSANAVVTLAVTTVFPNPQTLQKFSTDSIYDSSSVKPTEVQMGVDGFQSLGFVFVSRAIVFTLMADSPSNAFFDAWDQAQIAAKDAFACNGLIVLPGPGSKFTLVNGGLTNFTPLPPGGKILGPRKFEITFERIIPAAA